MPVWEANPLTWILIVFLACSQASLTLRWLCCGRHTVYPQTSLIPAGQSGLVSGEVGLYHPLGSTLFTDELFRAGLAPRHSHPVSAVLRRRPAPSDPAMGPALCFLTPEGAGEPQQVVSQTSLTHIPTQPHFSHQHIPWLQRHCREHSQY